MMSDEKYAKLEERYRLLEERHNHLEAKYSRLLDKVGDVRSDVAVQAHASRFLGTANKEEILKNENAIKENSKTLSEVQASLKVIENRISTLEETKREHTGQIRHMELNDAVASAKDSKKSKPPTPVTTPSKHPEAYKARYGFYGAALLVLTPILVLLLRWFLGLGVDE